MAVDVKVEYCGTCGYASKYEELSKAILTKFPDINIEGYEGRRATFEVKVNDVLVHSKLTTLAWPDHEDVLKIVEEAEQGKDIRQAKAQPLFNCNIL